MSSLNKVQLIGNLGRDPEIRSFQNGGRVAQLAVATNERWRDRNTQEMKERTEWHRVVVYADTAIGYVERRFRKGSKVYVEGQVETRKWTDQEGRERYITEIVVRPYRGDVKLLDGQETGERREQADRQDEAVAPRGANGSNGSQANGRGQGSYPGGFPTGRGASAQRGAAGGRPQSGRPLNDDIPF